MEAIWLGLHSWDKTFKQVGVDKPLAVDKLPRIIIVEGMDFFAKMVSHESHLFVNKENLFENYKNYSVWKGQRCNFYMFCFQCFNNLNWTFYVFIWL